MKSELRNVYSPGQTKRSQGNVIDGRCRYSNWKRSLVSVCFGINKKDTQLLVILKCEEELDEERVFEDGHQISLSLHVLDFVLLYNMAFL